MPTQTAPLPKNIIYEAELNYVFDVKTGQKRFLYDGLQTGTSICTDRRSRVVYTVEDSEQDTLLNREEALQAKKVAAQSSPGKTPRKSTGNDDYSEQLKALSDEVVRLRREIVQVGRNVELLVQRVPPQPRPQEM